MTDATTTVRQPAVSVRALPADKAEFPKVLAIDCNHWIALAQVHYGRSTDGAARAALDAMRAAVSSNRLIVPLHFINVVEAAKRIDDSSRERLVRFMVAEAQNRVVRPFHLISAAETRAAIENVYLARRVQQVRPFVVGYGADELMDAARSDAERETETMLESAKLGEAYAAMLASPEWTVAAILEGMCYDSAADRVREAKGAEVIRRTRLADSALSTKERARLELGNQWNSRRGDTVRTMLDELGIHADVFHQWLFADEHIFRFWEAIPSVHVVLQLEIASTKQRDRDFEVNDFRDVSFYEAALPYANVVLTEKYWADRIRYAKLDQRYGTRVLRRVADLPAVLMEEKCL